MSLSYRLICLTNKIFKPVVHPFNLQNDGVKTYAEWQYEKGGDTVQFFTERYATETLFGGKRVLDMGCGAAGKSLYYAKMGAKQVVGVDIVEDYRQEAEALAEKLGLSDKFTFHLGSADHLEFEDGSFDTIIMNDFMEHTSDPEATLKEALRLLSKDGRIYINFPPYGHPYGAHMSDLINMPWVHCFFTENSLCIAYKKLAENLPDGEWRINFRIRQKENSKWEIAYINKMTLRRFKKILKAFEIEPEYYAEVSLRGPLKVLARFPLTKEWFVRMAVCVIKK